MRKKLWRIFVLMLPWVLTLWLISSIIFWTIGASAGTVGIGIIFVKAIVNWVLGIFSFISLFLMLPWFILLFIGKKTSSYINEWRNTARKNFRYYRKPLVLVILTIIILSWLYIIYGVVTNPITWIEEDNIIWVIFNIVITIFGFIYGIGLIKLGLQSKDKEKKFSRSTMFVHKRSELWKMFVSQILFFIIAFIPAVLTIGLFVWGGGSILWKILEKKLTGELSWLLMALWENIGILGGFVLLGIGLIALFYLIYLGMRVSLVLKYVAIDHNNLNPWEIIKRSWNISKGNVWKIFVVDFITGLTNILWVFTFWISLLWTIPLTMIAKARIYQDIDKKYEEQKQKEWLK